MVPFRVHTAWFAMVAVAFVCRTADGAVDDFQCACSYNARENVQRIRLMLADGDRDAVEFAATYGPLVSRMLFVAHGRREPVARWLWQLNLFANTVRQLFGWRPSATAAAASPEKQRMADNPIFSRTAEAEMMASALDRVSADLNAYLKVCWGRQRAVGVGMSQEVFENYVLEAMTSVVQKPDHRDDRGSVRVENFEPRCFYLNDVPANGTDGLAEILTRDVGIEWRDAADRLSRLYGLSKRNWMLGTRELVLYQKTFVSTVVASMMGYVLVHVTYCQEHWLANFKDNAARTSDAFLVGEYERVWMSVTSLLEKFKQYLDLGRETYFETLMNIAANPVCDNDGFEAVKFAIRTEIDDVGAGTFSLGTIKVNRIADSEKSTEKSIIGLIALVDNNISAAEKYLSNLQRSLLDVNFEVIRDFMRSTHFWLT